MAKPAVFTWLAPNAAAICALQTTAGAQTLLLNGTLVNFQYPRFVSLGNVSRTISITSTVDLSLINFTVTGMLNGSVVSEVKAGPNNNTVYTTQVFDIINSVTVSGVVGTNVSVGIGTTGFTRWFNHNPHSSVLGFTVAVEISGTINYTFQTTLDDVQLNASPGIFTPIDGTAGSPGFPADMTNINSNQIAFTNNFVTSYSRIAIVSSTDGSLTATFLQQGIT